jgi:hypothetical protein
VNVIANIATTREEEENRVNPSEIREEFHMLCSEDV